MVNQYKTPKILIVYIDSYFTYCILPNLSSLEINALPPKLLLKIRCKIFGRASLFHCEQNLFPGVWVVQRCAGRFGNIF